MPGYLTKTESVSFPDCADLHIRSLLDRQQFSDPLGAALALGISSATWPLFGLLWPSGQMLAERLGRRVVSRERILEVGCGLGLASLVAHRRGADITASDHHPLAGEFMAHNAALNHLAHLPYRHGDWAAEQHQHAVGSDGDRTLVNGRFDLIVGADLLYDRDASSQLAPFISAHASPCAEVWIIDPDRSNRGAFHRGMDAAGFERREERLDRVETTTRAAYKGRLLMYWRGAVN
jgi:predicted nicotinamide N-methyase